MGASKTRREIEAMLRETGLDWRIEPGGNHNKIYLANKFISICHPGNQSFADHMPLKTAIKRRLKELGITS